MQITQQRTFNVPDELMNELACSLITTAVEGGIKYWASVSNYRWGSPDLGHSDNKQTLDGITHPWTEGDREYCEATVHDNEDDTHGPWEIDAAKMIKAIKLLVTTPTDFHTMGYDKTFKTRLIDLFTQAETNPDLSFIDADFDFDASDAECMMQIACMGEVVYG